MMVRETAPSEDVPSMPCDEFECSDWPPLLSIIRLGSPNPEVEFDDYISKISVCLAPEDEESGPVVGIRFCTRDGTRAVLVMCSLWAAAELAQQIGQITGNEGRQGSGG